MDIAKLDRFMQARPAQEEGVRWLAPFEPPLVLEGFAFFEQNFALSLAIIKGISGNFADFIRYFT